MCPQSHLFLMSQAPPAERDKWVWGRECTCTIFINCSTVLLTSRHTAFHLLADILLEAMAIKVVNGEEN